MSQTGASYMDGGSGQVGSWLRSEGREPGARRKKLAGYLKAANELRQSYQQSYASGWRSNDQYDDYDDGTPGAFPDAAVVRNGQEEMILFPSYARRHVKRKPDPPKNTPDPYNQGQDDSQGTNDAEYWKREWERYEDDHAIVDVDVRGWIYTPHSGPLNRKHRIFIGLARQLVGISAPPADSGGSNKLSRPGSSPASRASSPGRLSHRERLMQRADRNEEEMASKEAQSIMRKGELEVAKAGKGEYSEAPASDADSIVGRSQNNSPARGPGLHRQDSSTSVQSTSSGLYAAQRQQGRNQLATMSPEELKEANSHLMARLKPFLANPMANSTISVFFFNEKDSRQKTVTTDASGHFSVRAALEFVPTHVRVLASDKLSATEEIHITEPNGVSVISDIDDTIKHSAINSGAREIFRNAFIRDLGGLTIEGVKEWYNRLADMGVKFHYVSNSPWQIYPVLTSYFSMAGLPPGSFHLKQYSGMLQGIFEPVAERKKGTLDKIARDFPERRFILVGDSGEADLEVYTDFVLENPGRVLAIFIRDVTTPTSQGFFDPSVGPLAGSGSEQGPTGNEPSYAASSRRQDEEEEPEFKAAIAASLREFEQEEKKRKSYVDHTDSPESRPKLPPRRPTDPGLVANPSQAEPSMGKLIDFSDDEPASAPPTPPLHRTTTNNSTANGSQFKSKGPPPVAPKKPAALRAVSTGTDSSSGPQSPAKRVPPPPRPRRSSSSIQVRQDESRSQNMNQNQEKPNVPSKPSSLNEQQGYISAARQKVSSVYNNLPSASAYWHSDPTTKQDQVENSTTASVSQNRTQRKAPPPPPARRTITSYPAAAASYAGNRVSTLYHGTNTNPTSVAAMPLPPLSAVQSQQQQYSTSSNSNNSSSSNWNNGNNDSNNNPKISGIMKQNSWPTSGLSRTGTDLSATSTTQGGQALPNKREELWRRRWARAQQILAEKGVLLKSWRIGSDVMEQSAKLVEKAISEDKKGGQNGQRK